MTTPIFLSPKPRPAPLPAPAAWVGRNVSAAKMIAARRLDPAATIELLRGSGVRGALFFLIDGGGRMDLAAQREKLARWLRKFRVDDPDLAGTIAAALRLPGDALTTLRDYIHEEHAEERRAAWRYTRDRSVVDWATGLIGQAIGPRGSVTLDEAGKAAAAILDWIEAAGSFRPARAGFVIRTWLADLERRAQGHRLPRRRRTLRVAPRQPGRAAPDPAIWAKAATGDWR